MSVARLRLAFVSLPVAATLLGVGAFSPAWSQQLPAPKNARPPYEDFDAERKKIHDDFIRTSVLCSDNGACLIAAHNEAVARLKSLDERQAAVLRRAAEEGRTPGFKPGSLLNESAGTHPTPGFKRGSLINEGKGLPKEQPR